MGFMSAYKHLDNLCKQINGVGVSGYIDDMDTNPDASFNVPGWKDDYRKLKHYRWIRNQIAHEDYADEENMCECGDTEWIEQFYDRLFNQTDPLTLYRKASSIHLAYQSAPVKTKRAVNTYHPQTANDMNATICRSKQRKNNTPRIIACIMLIIAAVFTIFALNHPEMSFPWSNKITYLMYGIYSVIMFILFIIPRRNR